MFCMRHHFLSAELSRTIDTRQPRVVKIGVDGVGLQLSLAPADAGSFIHWSDAAVDYVYRVKRAWSPSIQEVLRSIHVNTLRPPPE